MKVPSFDHISNLLFESIDEGLIVTNKTGDIIFSNPRGAEMFGYEKEGLNGIKVEELIPMKQRKKHVGLRDNYQKAPSKRRMGMNVNLEAQRKDGSTFFVEISLNSIKSDGQNFSVALITDISLRVEQEEKIRELNSGLEAKVKERTKEVLEGHKLYSAIATNFPNGTINVFDRELKYVFVEGLELKELGLSTKNLIGTSYLDKISQEIRPTIEKQLVEVFKGKAKDFELVHLEQTYRINAVPLSETKKVLIKS